MSTHPMRKLLARLVRASVAEEVADELAFHIEMTTRELIAQGMPSQQARAEAERRFGDAASVNAECRRYGEQRDRIVRRTEYLAELRQDVAFAVRQLAKVRGFTAIAVLTLALGIGATAAMFSALDAVVLRSLPFPDADRIVALHPRSEGREAGATPPEFYAYRTVRDFQHVAAARLGGGVALQSGDLPEIVEAAEVTTDYFAVFGVPPQYGRTFTADEDRAGGPGAVILSHRFWTSRFGGDISVLNRVLQIDGTPHTVVGIMPASFDYVSDGPKMWMPLALAPEAATQYGAHYLAVTARLRPDVTIDQARPATLAAHRSVARANGKTGDVLDSYGIDLHRFADDLVEDYRSLLFILLGAVGFVLLIACANVANLLLARGTTRARELAIRAALGAGRGRLFRQLLTESMVLSFAGSIAGLGVAFGLLRVLRVISPSNVPRLDQAGMDWRVLGVTLMLGAMSTLLFGLAPALRAARPQVDQALREGGRTSGLARDRLRPILVGAQVALTLALLVGAGLLIRSAWRIQQVDPGFDPRGVLAARLVLPQVRYPTGDAVVRLYNSVRAEAERLPGTKSAALTSVVPLSGSKVRSTMIAEGRTRQEGVEGNLRLASDGYFDTMRIPLIVGRDLARTDAADGTPVVVVTEAVIRGLWPGMHPRDAIGKRINALPTRRTDLKFWEIVGVVGDLHDAALTKAPEPEMYLPIAQTPDAFWPFLSRSLVVVVRLADDGIDPKTLERPLQRAVARIDPALPVAEAMSMEGYLAQTLATARMNTILLSMLGAIALVLAMVGIYGVVAYFVSQRTQEIGVRTALGATPSDIWRFVVRRGMLPVAVGLVIGIALAFATSRLLSGQLYGVTAQDPFTFVAVGALLLIVAVMAMFVPARRAMRVSPVVALSA
jgi:putative ABC transport system permease protein